MGVTKHGEVVKHKTLKHIATKHGKNNEIRE